MKLTILTLLCVGLSAACSSKQQLLTIPHAHVALQLGEQRQVSVPGYFVFHFEGDSLEIRPGDPSNGILLVFSPKFRSEKPSSATVSETDRERYDQRYVIVHGLLKRGEFMTSAGKVSDAVFLEIEEITVPKNPPKRPQEYRQF